LQSRKQKGRSAKIRRRPISFQPLIAGVTR
jgi:hypothetical protein